MRVGGTGPALLLLHGYPQTHHMWHRLAERLRDRFTLFCADLPGYGASYRPSVTPDHAGHSKRAMAQSLVEAMGVLGQDAWMVGAHDRGARVAHRMALDHSKRVRRLALLDIAPTREMYRDTTDKFARAYWHWFFLIQPAPLPERMIGADPDGYWTAKCVTGRGDVFDPRARAAYLAAFRDPAATEASCEDYRAAATIDIQHDNEDRDRKLTQPLLVLWGADGVIAHCFDALALWRERAEDVRGWALPGGHYLAEEQPDEVASAFAGFLSS
jgi:haloacetate dehalogenase